MKMQVSLFMDPVSPSEHEAALSTFESLLPCMQIVVGKLGPGALLVIKYQESKVNKILIKENSGS